MIKHILQHKKQALIIGLLILALMILLLSKLFATISVEAVRLTPEPLEISFTEDGTVSLTEYYSLYAPTNAKVTAVYVKEDAHVKKGTKIAQLDTTDLEREVVQHNQNILAYEAQIADAASGERNTKDDYVALLNQLYAQKAQIEAEMMISDTAGVSQTLPEESLTILQAQVEQYEGEVAYYQDLYDRQTTLYEAGAISQVELEQTGLQLEAVQTALAQYQQQMSAAKQELARLEEKYGTGVNINSLNEEGRAQQYQAMLDSVNAQIVSAQANMGKDYSGDTIEYYQAMIEVENNTIAMLKDTIKDCTITAAMDGIIYDLPVQNASMIYQQSTVCVLKPESAYKIESYVSTKDVTALEIGGPVQIIQSNRDENIYYTGEIEYIADWAEESVSALGLIEHKVKVVIQPLEDLTNAGEGFGLDVKYIYYQNQNALSVPKSSVFEYDDTSYVYVLRGKRAVQTEVTTGASSTTETVILEGLEQGDIVIKYASQEGLQNDARVTYTLT